MKNAGLYYGIVFIKQQSDSSVRGYVNADYASDLDDRRSTTSYVFTLGGDLFVGSL